MTVIFILLCLFFASAEANACTSFLVTRGASKDGSTLITYAGDSHIRYGQLYFFPRGSWPEEAVVTIYDRSSNRPLGQIPQARETYQVIGFINEHQVAIGESTFEGRKELVDRTGLIDWGSLMFLGLQRAKSAREAIKVMVELVAEHGYYSSGQSYSIADPDEVWILELIGKGVGGDPEPGHADEEREAARGAVWVAMRVPDGYISAHANHSRITTFPRENETNSISCRNLDRIFDSEIGVVYAHDVIDFARARGYYAGDGSDFSFSQAYAPLDFRGARICDLRVWAMFNEVSDDMARHWDYATGKSEGPRIPLFIKPDRKLSPQDLMNFKRNTLAGTELDMSQDFGAGPHARPYRWRPLYWELDGKRHFHERATATQQTAFSFVAQMRRWLPDPIGGILWYGLDDTGLTVHAPFYCGMTDVPRSYAQGNGDILTYSEDAAFWVFNRVSHVVYLFYDRAIGDIRKKQSELQGRFAAFVPAIDAGALVLHGQDPALARTFLTEFSHNTADNLLRQWRDLGNFLLVKLLDGNIKQERDGRFLRNPWGFPLKPEHPEYPEEWKRRLVEQTGEKFRLPQQ